VNKEQLFELWNKKYFRWSVIGMLSGLSLIFIGSFMNSSNDTTDTVTDTQAYYSVRFYTESLEERIESLCCQVDGVKEAHVLLTLEGGSEYVYAENVSGTTRELFSLDCDGDERAVLLQEIYPKIRGVAVVCTRGNDTSIKLTITQLLCAALGIPSSSVQVAGT